MSQAALKANKVAYGLVRKIDRNSRALAKIVSAMEWLSQYPGEDLAPFNVAMFDLVQLRRNLRAALEAALVEERKRQCSTN